MEQAQLTKFKAMSALEFMALSPAEKSAFQEALRFEKGVISVNAETVTALNAKGMDKTQGGFTVYKTAVKGKNDQLGGISMLSLVVNHGRGERDNLFVKLAPGKKADAFDIGKAEALTNLTTALANVKADYLKDVQAIEAAIKAIQ